MNTKNDRSTLFARLAAEGHTQAETARIVGLSRERVRQLGAKYGIIWPTRGRRCARCGAPLKHDTTLCGSCYARKVEEGRKDCTCATCGKVFTLFRHEQLQRFRRARKLK